MSALFIEGGSVFCFTQLHGWEEVQANILQYRPGIHMYVSRHFCTLSKGSQKNKLASSKMRKLKADKLTS